MILRVTYTPKAERDLIKIERYLATRFYPGNAIRFVERIRATCRSLAVLPQRGSPRNNIGPGVRALGFERRVVIHFVVAEESVIIFNVSYRGKLPKILSR